MKDDSRDKREEILKNFKKLLENLESLPELTDELMKLFYTQIERFANFDHFREIRAGKPEAVFGPGKSSQEIVKILKKAMESSGGILVTRVSPEQIKAIKEEFRGKFKLEINERSGTVILGEKKERMGKVAILTAGTSDIPVAEEAATTAEFLGLEVIKEYDVGVAGIHRLFNPLVKILEEGVDSIIVVAGMEGALPSVVAGLVDIPVIAVPTSVGYGANLNGITTLFSMLQSCSSGVAVVNIDNGFGAAVFASMISRVKQRRVKEGFYENKR
jgi:hypothetical protein